MEKRSADQRVRRRLQNLDDHVTSGRRNRIFAGKFVGNRYLKRKESKEMGFWHTCLWRCILHCIMGGNSRVIDLIYILHLDLARKFTESVRPFLWLSISPSETQLWQRRHSSRLARLRTSCSCLRWGPNDFLRYDSCWGEELRLWMPRRLPCDAASLLARKRRLLVWGMKGWMNGGMNEWRDEWMNGGMNEWRDEWMNEWMKGWINDRMNGWMDKLRN